MLNTSKTCKAVSTLKERSWDYEQYYVGDKDKEGRKNGDGANHWSGAKSLEWYDGPFVRDTMHGVGDYCWRFRGPENAFVSYEGYFYCNQIHGFGTMSYPNGRTFTGLFLNNFRWGPGIEFHADLCADVGLWRGLQILRLSWWPSAPNIVPDFMSIPAGRAIVESHRTMLQPTIKTVGEVNSAIELLKQCGADSRVAVARWSKVYPKYCTDISSPLCHVEYFNQDYYKGKIIMLQETDKIPDHDGNDDEEHMIYYAWNNDRMVIDMMKHSYKHQQQINPSILDLKSILSGPRNQIKPPGTYELKCRTLLMACYLGYISDVARLVNENNINPNICDGHGNSAVMYAVCGDQADIVHFLVEAGANIDSYNDNCCTPLGVALMRYTCIQNDIQPNAMLQALLPPSLPTAPPPVVQKVFEWNMIRDHSSPSTGGTLTKIPSKTKNMSSKKIKSSLVSLKDQPPAKKKTDPALLQIESDAEPFSEEMRLYNDITNEYCLTVTDTYTTLNTANPIPYLFNVNDMLKDIDIIEEDQKKQTEKAPKKVASKIIKETIKTSKDMMFDDKDKQSIDSAQKMKIDMSSKSMFTILQLLLDGADPKYVRCPQPALLIALTSNCPDLIRHLIKYGADVNETYSEIFNYSALDVVISKPFTYDNLEIIRALLENGADASHRLDYKPEIKDVVASDEIIPGPTLLHVVVGRRTESDIEEEIRRQLLDLLLEHNCSGTAQFQGRSAIDIAMNKSMELLNIFINNPKTEPNAVINRANQCILIKMFTLPFFRSISSAERLQTLTHLLLFGADPLIKCQNNENIYQNIFVFTKQTLSEMDSTQAKSNSPENSKTKKPEKPKKDEKLSTKSVAKMAVDEVEDYKQATELLTDCARLIYIKWLQAKLMKELIKIINRYRHRHWNMIIKELNGNKNCLWLTPQRCFEIWDILSTTRNKIYNDKRILRHLLCIVIFMSWKNYSVSKGKETSEQVLTAPLRDAIEMDVTRLLRQRNLRRKITSRYDFDSSQFLYLKPELVKDDKTFNVCFECIIPLDENKIICCWCKLVSFCSIECIKMNIERVNCHPCSEYLKLLYCTSEVHQLQADDHVHMEN